MKSRAPHVVAVMARVDPLEPRAHSVCLHCGTRLVIELPVEVSVWAAANFAFVDAHRHCRPKQSATELQPTEKAPDKGAVNPVESGSPS